MSAYEFLFNNIIINSLLCPLRCMEVLPDKRLFWMNYNGKSCIYKCKDDCWWIGEEVDSTDIMYTHELNDPHGRVPPREGRII